MTDKIEQIKTLSKLPPRSADAHKGDFGRVLVVGGSRGMIGAPALAANAALCGGAGLVTVATPEPIQLAVASLCPCATSVILSCDVEGQLASGAVRDMLAAAGDCDVLAVGPGMARGVAQQNLVRAAIEQDKPVVLDADGLNNLAAIENWPTAVKCPLVLTPHPGEFARLVGGSASDSQSDRQAAAVNAARKWSGDMVERPLVCVLKGAGTVVTDGQRVYTNTTGNPGMATGGSGDVLTGLIAALIGQKLPPFEAACLGVYCHGLAGDFAADEIGQVSLMATDLLDYLPEAMKESA